ncbi:MAG: hypothetical protein AAF708_03125 [Deinococcota bacterium]
MASTSPSPQVSTDVAERLPLALTVKLARGDFIYYNWTAAFDKPILPFFLYTFVLLNLSSLLGVFPDGNVFAFAVLIPLVGLIARVQIASSLLWRRVPRLAAAKNYSFKQKSYQLKTSTEQADTVKVVIDYADVAKVLVSRRGYYLIRADGSADIIPKMVVDAQNISPDAFSAWLDANIETVTSSFFL